MERNKTWRVYKNGKALEAKADAKSILKGARFKLTTEVFRNSSCNNVISVIPEFGFEDTELDGLNLTLTPQEWAKRFIDILLNRHNVVECLNILCNLHKYQLRNYQLLIVELFKNLPNVEVREVEEDCDNIEKTGQYVMFQGNKVKLEELMNQITTPIDQKILDELASGNIPIIVNNQVPDKLEYYVHRTVTSRNRLKLDVLKHDCKDVFVVEGIDRHKLTLLVRDTETTDLSGNQLKKLTVRFILLQLKDDFDGIRKLANSSSLSIHWVRYNGKNFELVYSEAVENLKEYIDEEQEQPSFYEDELASSTQKVVIIADSPGMGKTSLLLNIAHHFMRLENEMLTRFIVIKEFVEALSKMKINVESIVKIISHQSSEYKFGRKLVEHNLETKPCVLLFDGFDEVLPNQVSNANKILQITATLPNVRIFVATRRHFQDELENSLQALGFTIQPFDESNQIIFLLKFWKMKGATPNESLTKFSETCVEQLTSKMTDSERNIAGIPLQCRLLAETYEEDAIRCSNTGFSAYESQTAIALIDSIFGMYKKHMNMRFEKMCKQESLLSRLFSKFTKPNQHHYEIIKNVHMYYALELLFPYYANQFKNLNTSTIIPLNELCGLGLLEVTHSNDIRFVHRTFAEFLVAWFVHENKNTSSKLQEFVLSILFKTHPFVLTWPTLKVPSTSVHVTCYKFLFPVICYFINGFATVEDPTNFRSYHYLEELLPIYTASAYHNYDHIPYTFEHYLGYFDQTQVAKESDVSNLLLIAAMNSNLDLMKLLCSNIHIASMQFYNVESTNEIDSFMISPLHMAIMRGHYNLVEYIIKEFENKVSEHRYLVHFCVTGSLFESKYIVEEKISIIKLLNEINKECIYEKLLDQRSPIMQRNVNSKLVECLMQIGAELINR